MKFNSKKTAELWKNANRPAFDEALDSALNLSDTLYVDGNLFRPGSSAPSHIQAYDHNLCLYASIPLSR